MAQRAERHSNLSCSVCTSSEARVFCPCRESPLLFCESCISKHFFKSTDRCHSVLPIEALPYYKLPGYIEAYNVRSGEQRTAARKQLSENAAKIDSVCAAIRTETETVINLLGKRCEKQIEDLQAIRNKLENAIGEGIKEFEDTIYEPDPILRTEIGRRIRKFAGLDLVSIPTDIGNFFSQCQDLMRTSAVFVQMEIPELVFENAEPPVVAFPKDALNPSSDYIGQTNAEMHRHGYGQGKITPEVSFEGRWVNTCHSDKGKLTWSDGSFLVGNTKLCPIAKRRESSCCGRWTKRLAISLLVLLIARNFYAKSDQCMLWITTIRDGELFYVGEIDSKGERNGRGILEDNEHNRYIGQWMQQQRHGLGTFVSGNSSKYHGEWKNDLYDGYGELTKGTDFVYKGMWMNGTQHGIGLEIEKTSDGYNETYLGEYSQAQRTGLGVLAIGNRIVFAGWKSANNSYSGVECRDGRLCYSWSTAVSPVCVVFPEQRYSFEQEQTPISPKNANPSENFLSFSTSVELDLTGIVFLNGTQKCKIEQLEVIAGSDTQGKKLYTHPGNEGCFAGSKNEVLVQFNRTIRIVPGESYTIRSVIKGDMKMKMTSEFGKEKAGVTVWLVNTTNSERGEKRSIDRGNDIFAALIYRLVCQS